MWLVVTSLFGKFVLWAVLTSVMRLSPRCHGAGVGGFINNQFWPIMALCSGSEGVEVVLQLCR